MTKSDRPRLKDLRDAYRLVGECRELGDDSTAWRRHMLEGLRRLTGAQLALYLQIRGLGGGSEEIAEPMDAGFMDESGRALWAHYQLEQAHRDDPFHLSYYKDFTGALRTRRLDTVVDLREWRNSRHYNEYIRACGLDDRITTSIGLAQASTIQVVVLHRAAADGQYARRMARLVHLFHHELSTLLGRQLRLPEDASPPLPCQLQEVLVRLLEGESEKRIAAGLGLSRHTVNRHVQRLYRRFDVHSRGELMFRCRDMLPALQALLQRRR